MSLLPAAESHMDCSNLDRYMDVYGNFHDGCYYLAIIFKKPILIYESVLNEKICIPEDRIAYLEYKDYVLLDKTDGLIFVRGQNDGDDKAFYMTNLAPDRKEFLEYYKPFCVTKLLFPPGSILLYECTGKEVFVQSTVNPFKKFWKLLRRSVSFYSLTFLLSRVRVHGRLDFRAIRQLQNFASGDCTKSFRYWWSMVFRATERACLQLIGIDPDPVLGRLVAEILERSDSAVEKTDIPLDFYTCRLTLDDSCPPGVQFISGGRYSKVMYVSPMIVSKTEDNFYDVNHFMCDGWLPLYKSKKVWQESGLNFYLPKLGEKRMYLDGVMDWVKIQTPVIYQHVYYDLCIIKHILFGKQE